MDTKTTDAAKNDAERRHLLFLVERLQREGRSEREVSAAVAEALAEPRPRSRA